MPKPAEKFRRLAEVELYAFKVPDSLAVFVAIASIGAGERQSYGSRQSYFSRDRMPARALVEVQRVRLS